MKKTTFLTLASDQRLAIIRLLQRTAMSQTNMAATLSTKNENLVQHLYRLEHEGIIRRRGQMWTLNPFWADVFKEIEKLTGEK